jgi:hypothetical protein
MIYRFLSLKPPGKHHLRAGIPFKLKNRAVASCKQIYQIEQGIAHYSDAFREHD